jgi:hypothetical protein
MTTRFRGYLKAFASPETLSLDTSILLTQNHIISYAGYCADCFSVAQADKLCVDLNTRDRTPFECRCQIEVID